MNAIFFYYYDKKKRMFNARNTYWPVKINHTRVNIFTLTSDYQQELLRALTRDTMQTNFLGASEYAIRIWYFLLSD